MSLRGLWIPQDEFTRGGTLSHQLLSLFVNESKVTGEGHLPELTVAQFGGVSEAAFG